MMAVFRQELTFGRGDTNGLCVLRIMTSVWIWSGIRVSGKDLLPERWEYYRRNLSMFQSITTVFAVSDYYAMDLICFLQEQGIRVPEQISVAGFDDIPMCRMFCPTLTTVKQDGALRAKIAVEKLRELKEGKPIQNEIRLPVSLVVRSSTK